MEDPEATGFDRISIDDLDRRPNPLPNADARRAGELDLPAGAFDGSTRPEFGDARPVRTARTQRIGKDGDRVVALEGDEGRRFGQALAEGRLDACTEWTEALGQIAQERDRGAVIAEQRHPFGELGLPGRSTYHDPGQALVLADGFDDRYRGLRVAHQKKEGRRAMVDEFVAHRRRSERAQVEFEHGAAAWSEILPQNARPGCPIDTRLDGYGDSAMARTEQEVCVDPPAMGLRRGQARDPFRRLFGERIEYRRRTEEREAEGIGSGGDSASDDAVIFPRQRSHAQVSPFIYGRRGLLWIGRGVSDHQFEWPSDDPAGVIDFANRQLESSEQVVACLDPSRPSERNQRTDPDG